jgi:hypothetical protein
LRKRLKSQLADPKIAKKLFLIRRHNEGLYQFHLNVKGLSTRKNQQTIDDQDITESKNKVSAEGPPEPLSLDVSNSLIMIEQPALDQALN